MGGSVAGSTDTISMPTSDVVEMTLASAAIGGRLRSARDSGALVASEEGNDRIASSAAMRMGRAVASSRGSLSLHGISRSATPTTATMLVSAETRSVAVCIDTVPIDAGA